MITSLPKLYVPLVTPMIGGVFDKESFKNLLASIEEDVYGYVPCLSSGEGAIMSSDLWQEVVQTTLENTKKPVFAGIKRQSKQEVFHMLDMAYHLGAHGVVTPVVCPGEEYSERYIQELSAYSKLPIILYNTETNYISDMDTLQRIDKLPHIRGIKDSSGDEEFFKNMLLAKKEGKIGLQILQGMENKLRLSKGCDGFLIALSNIEPELCKKYLNTGHSKYLPDIQEVRQKYNLGGSHRYITLKAALMTMGIITSAEEINALPYHNNNSDIPLI